MRTQIRAALVGAVSFGIALLVVAGAQAGTIGFDGYMHGYDIDGDVIVEDGRQVMISASVNDAGPGAAIFDTSFGGANGGGCTSSGMGSGDDVDLCVDQGPALILQDIRFPDQTIVAGRYDNPNDEGSPVTRAGTLTIMFDDIVRLESILLIDVNGSAGQTLELVSAGGSRTYTVPAEWTGEPSAVNDGFLVLDLLDTSPQAGNTGSATASTDAGFDENAVTKLIITPNGSSAWDTIQFVPTPEPTTALLILAGLTGLSLAGRRRH